MNYATWAKEEDVLAKLTKVNLKTKVEGAGVPIMYDKENLYISSNESHSLIIGASGSGKTQTIVLPTMNLAIKAGESIVANDISGELHEVLKNKLKENGYNTVILDFDSFDKNSWNPLELAKNMYKENSDKGEMELSEIGSYLFFSDNVSDEFWTNSAKDLFSGLAIYLINQDKNINISDIANLANELNNKEKASEFLNKFPKNSSEYYHLVGVLNAPEETRASIISVFNQSINFYTTREKLSNMLSKTDFNLNSIDKEKTAIFIKIENQKKYDRLISLFISQINKVKETSDRYVNVFIDEMENLFPISDISNIMVTSRRKKIRFTILTSSLMLLSDTYKNMNLDALLMCFGNIIYLYSNDIYTLEKVSKLCGNISKDEPLITPEQLRVIDKFEAVVILPRTMPYKTKLIPDYKINW